MPWNGKETVIPIEIVALGTALKGLVYSVGWGCRILRLSLNRGVRLPNNTECPGYDTKQSDGETPVMLELWGIRSTLSLSSLPGPLWPGVVAFDRVLFMVK